VIPYSVTILPNRNELYCPINGARHKRMGGL